MKRPTKRTVYIMDRNDFMLYLCNLLCTDVAAILKGRYDMHLPADGGSDGDDAETLTRLFDHISSDLGVTLESCHAGEEYVWLLVREERNV